MFGNQKPHHHHHDHDHGDPRTDQADVHPGRSRAGRRGPGGPFGGPFGGFGGPGGRGPRGRARRAARGDVRQGILVLLAEQPMHGYQIIQELGERSGGVWTPSPGSVYPTLSALEDEGLVVADQAEGKRVFQLTESGRAAVAASADRPKPWDEVAGDADSSWLALRDQMFQLGAATMQVAQAGSAPQIAQAQKILADARRALYLLLAEDTTVPADAEVQPDAATDEPS